MGAILLLRNLFNDKINSTSFVGLLCLGFIFLIIILTKVKSEDPEHKKRYEKFYNGLDRHLKEAEDSLVRELNETNEEPV